MTSIPAPIIAVVADVLSFRFTHAELNNRFFEAGASEDPPADNKLEKCRVWLTRTSRDPAVDGLSVLGRLIEGVMEFEGVPEFEEVDKSRREARHRVEKALAGHGLAYYRGGRVTRSGAVAPTRSLESLIRERDLPGIHGARRIR